MTITQRIAALTGGVSQRPQSQRTSGQADAQTNAHNHPLRGLMKRPPLAHFLKFSSSTSGLAQGFVCNIDLSPSERFIALMRSGTLAVFDKVLGTELGVTILHNDSYITPVVDPIVVEDNFTEATDLITMAAHPISATGGLWTKWFSTDSLFYSTIVSNRVKFQRILTGTKEAYLWPDAPPTADYTVEATVRRNATGDVHLVGPIGRITVGSGGYAALMDGVNGVTLKKFNAAGVLTGITAVAQVWVAETDYRLKMVFLGTNIKVYLDDVLKINQTDASFALAGKGGIYGEGNQSGGTPGQFTYLDSFRQTYTPAVTVPRPPLRSVQVGKQTVVVNTNVTVRRSATSTSNKVFQALVGIRQADYGTQYSLTLNGVEIVYASPDGVNPQARTDIDTTRIAEKLKNIIDTSNNFDAFTITVYGSSLLITRTDGADFTITGDDGLADNGLVVIKGAIQRFTDLPTKAPSGYIVEIAGDPTNNFDNYYVRFDVTDTATSAGVWKECSKPGEPTGWLASTMPHVLTYKGSLIGDGVAVGTPAPPAIVPGGGGSATEDVFDAIDETPTILFTANLRNHGDDIDAFLAGANGIATNYNVIFDLDSLAADGDNSVDVVLQKRTSPGVFVELTRRTYGPSLYRRDEVLTAYNTVLTAGQMIRVRLEYASGVTPADEKRTFVRFRQATVNTLGETHKPITFVANTGKTITFDPVRIYPQGALIRVTCDGINFDYTPATDVTGAVVATTLKGTIDAHATFIATNPASGQILVTRVDAADPVITCAITWSELTTFHDSRLAMTVGALAGLTIKNLTDNSSGTVVTNTSTTVTVAALTGGIDNKFQKDDKCEVLQAGRYFTFGQATWADRKAGDLTTSPMPAIVDQPINDVLITKGRLGLIAGGNIVLSEVGALFNLFRTTVTQLLDGDPIDVKPAHGDAVRFHSYSAWDGRDIFWSSRHQFELSGEPILSPATVKLLPISEYPMDAIRPVVLGRFAYFVAKRQQYAQVWAYGTAKDSQKPEATQLTRDVSQYLQGNVLAIAGDEDLGAFFVLTDADRSKLYVHTYSREAGHFAWSQWQFPAGTSIVAMSILDGVLTLLTEHSDGAYVSTIDVEATSTIGLLDRSKTFASGTGTFGGGSTTWTLPYSCATNGSEGTIVVVNASTGAVITSTRPLATTVAAVGNFSATAVIIGITYTFSHTMSTIFPRKGELETAMIDGRLQLSRLRISYEDTRDFTVTVTPLARTARTRSVVKTTDTDGVFIVPVLCKNKDATITITSSLPTALRITDVEWEGSHYSRSTRK